MPSPAASPSSARPAGRWFRRLRWAGTALVLLAVLGGFARQAWLERQAAGVPLDWVALWGGEQSNGVARQCPPLKRFQDRGRYRIEPLPLDADGAYSATDSDLLVDLGQWWHTLDWTLAAWTRMDASATNWPDFPFVMAGGAYYPYEWLLVRKRGRMGVMLGTATPAANSTGPAHRPVAPWEFTVPFDEQPCRWVHLAASYESRTHEVVLYVAGREAGRTFHPNPPGIISQELFMGRDPWSRLDPPPLVRQVDDLALYERALSPAEIARLAATGRSGPARVLEHLAAIKSLKHAARSVFSWAASWLLLVWGGPPMVGWWWRTVFARTGGHRRAFAPVAAVLAIGLIGTAGTTGLAVAWLRSVAAQRFAVDIRQLEEAGDAHFEKTTTLLIAIRSQLAATGHFTKDDWSRALAATNLREDFPQIWPLGYAEYVPPGGRAEHEARGRQLWGEGYWIHNVAWNETPASDVSTNAALPILFMLPPGWEPTPRRAPPDLYLGRDLFATGLTDATNRLLARVALEGLTERRSAPPAEMSVGDVPGAALPGLMMFVPVPDRATADPRRGLLFAGTSLARFLDSNFGKDGPDFGMRWFWERDGVAPLLAADSGDVWEATREPAHPWLRRHETILLYGARLQCDFWTTPLFDRQNHRQAPWFIALTGVVVTVLAAGLVAGQVRTRLHEAKAAAQLRAVNGQLAAASRERTRLSRDLHDGTIQSLYALGLELIHAKTLLPGNPTQAATELGHSLSALQAVVNELRQFVLELEPEMFQGQTVPTALEQLVARLRRTTPLEFHLDTAPAAAALPPKTAIHVLNLVREALSNTLRHAEAQNVWVKLENEADTWRLVVEDDGRGFDPAANPSRVGRGLRGFEERSAELAGSCQISTTLGCGTRVLVRFKHPKTGPIP